MTQTQKNGSGFQRIGPCLYRYNSSGTYYAVARRDGKIVRRSLETNLLQVAKRKLPDELRDIEKVDRTSGTISLEEYADRFAESRVGAPKTVARYHTIAEKLKSRWPGGPRMRLDRITESQCRAWLAGFTFGPPSYNLFLQWMKGCFDQAVRERLIPYNPATAIKPRKRSKPVRLTPSPEEFEQILASVRAQIYSADARDSADLLEFMGRAGVGQAEVAGLTWKHIDWKNSSILAFRAKTRTAYNFPIYPQVRPLLERLRNENPEHEPDSPIFVVKDAKIALAHACKRLRLPNYSQRALRRLFITRAIQRGVDVKTVSAWQGHQDGGALVLKTYSHVVSSHANKMAELLV